MEKRIKLNDNHICTCPNQILLSAGSFCDLCMGFVTEDAWEPPRQPLKVQDPFDEIYFEELEKYYEDIEFAA